MQNGKFICQDLSPLGLSETTILAGSSQIELSGITTNPNSGDTFTITGMSSTLPANSALELRGPSVWQKMSIHTSCSQPLGVGDVFGAFTLVSMTCPADGSSTSHSSTVHASTSTGSTASMSGTQTGSTSSSGTHHKSSTSAGMTSGGSTSASMSASGSTHSSGTAGSTSTGSTGSTSTGSSPSPQDQQENIAIAIALHHELAGASQTVMDACMPLIDCLIPGEHRDWTVDTRYLTISPCR